MHVIRERRIAVLAAMLERRGRGQGTKAMAHSATPTTRLGAELKARILPRRGAAAPAPHKSSRFCLEQGGENRWSSPSFSLRLRWLYRRGAPRASARGYPVGTHERSCFLPLLRESPRFPASPPLPPVRRRRIKTSHTSLYPRYPTQTTGDSVEGRERARQVRVLRKKSVGNGSIVFWSPNCYVSHSRYRSFSIPFKNILNKDEYKYT